MEAKDEIPRIPPNHHSEAENALKAMRAMNSAAMSRIIILEEVMEAAKDVLEEADPRGYGDLTETQKILADKIKKAKPNESNQD